MNKVVSVIVSLIVPMAIFQVVKVLAQGIRYVNSASGVTSGLRMIGFGDMQTGIVVMMLLSLLTYMATIQVVGDRTRS
jgi:hypothetical protein